jgi:hypothetical protein
MAIKYNLPPFSTVSSASSSTTSSTMPSSSNDWKICHSGWEILMNDIREIMLYDTNHKFHQLRTN